MQIVYWDSTTLIGVGTQMAVNYTLLLYIHFISCVTLLKATLSSDQTTPTFQVFLIITDRVANESVKREDAYSKQLAIVICYDYINLDKLHYGRIKATVNITC